jgi:uncharacterized protein YprB with RNaseH-like and TPR domain
LSSLRSKLDRLEGLPAPRTSGGPNAPAAPATSGAPERPVTSGVTSRSPLLDDLRARMHAVLEKTARHRSRTPPDVDTRDEPDGGELPFVTTETDKGPLHLRRWRLSAAHRTGRASLLPARDASAELLGCLALDPSIAGCDPARALYLDTETTGLAGGTGTVAFLVGLAQWEAPADPALGQGSLVVEQVLVRNLGEEAPMLEHVAARMRDASMLVTFNGKTFDLPLLRTRFVMARIPVPSALPHLDLLHVARRLHKPRGVECKLVNIERVILGFERHDDVPSGDVSACYLHFLRTGDARALLGVIEHNAWDVVAMAALVGLYGEPLDRDGGRGALAADDLIGFARTMKRAGKHELAYDIATRAVDQGAGHESLRARAEIAKVRGDRERALVDYLALADKVDDPRVRLELAKLYEHYVKEPLRALGYVEAGTHEKPDAISKRHARLTRKARSNAGTRVGSEALFPQAQGGEPVKHRRPRGGTSGA